MQSFFKCLKKYSKFILIEIFILIKLTNFNEKLYFWFRIELAASLMRSVFFEVWGGFPSGLF